MGSGDSGREIGADQVRTGGQPPRSFDTSALFGGDREVVLIHKGEPYRLRLTQSGKLILTK